MFRLSSFSCVVLVLLMLNISLPSSHASILVWTCLQRCGYNETEVEAHFQQLETLILNQSIDIDFVAFEKFNLGPNSTLVTNNLFDANGFLKRRLPKVYRMAMVSSWPYPKSFLTWMRELFMNPYPFLSNLTQHLISEDIDAVNIDFEPTVTATAEDAQKYAHFLMKARLYLWKKGRKVVSVDVSRWSTLWNFTEISSALGRTLPTTTTTTTTTTTHVDEKEREGTEKLARWAQLSRVPVLVSSTAQSETGKKTSDRPPPPFPRTTPKGAVMTMNTYTNSNEHFLSEFNYSYGVFFDNETKAPKKEAAIWVVGLETWIKDTNYTAQDVAVRFNTMKEYSVCNVAIWDAPIPSFWVPFLADFSQRCRKK